MLDYKEMYLHLFREAERAINIQLEAQQQCGEMYISAPEHELRVLPKQGESDTRIYVTSMPDYKGMCQHLLQETRKAVFILLDAQIQCDVMSLSSMSPEFMLTSEQDECSPVPDEDAQKESRT